MPGPTAARLAGDLADEYRALDAVLAGLADDDWSRPTRAVGWDVRDTLGHLCWTDEAARLAVADPGRFAAEHLGSRPAEGPAPRSVELGRSLPPAELLRRWRAAGAGFLDAVAGADPAVRVPWFALPMGLASMLTARLMETWAHGVDIRDALGLPVEPSARLRHVCDLGHRARGYAFAVHGVDDPGDPVRLTVHAPDGTDWTWGPDDAADRITGSALDVALVFTQRRHPARSDVEAHGEVAATWLGIAQAFAGPATVAAPDR
ncbi:TIGR03084 family metal-binding protein [Blastococcus sp. URHD0036]|uniref:TIGR03084 family metal-binding protein n=1 Tax=Blastococcus sp. URHD0036 TaxID=1380356 RepID=UPI0004986919|nr:TIGR03084 family metal-binding protein [Blastococcus sp. URHD0036]